MSTSLRELLFNRFTVLVFIAGAGLSAGVAALAAQGMGMGAMHPGMIFSGNAAELAAHAEHILKHLYAEVDATDAQKAQIEPLVKQALSDLSALYTQVQPVHAQLMQALTQPTVDRNLLESAREAHLRVLDEGSRRLVQLIGDVSEVLTPQQRQRLAKHIQQMHHAAP